ncbi:MAG: tetratricopeptide repeat protein [Muribaculaceae bacterium]|nr:tetratricopeptide repeat protein [Muribaculaceae bacterium]
MKIRVLFKYFLIVIALASAAAASAQSTREERRLITSGNKLYVERKFKDAAAKYQDALKVNGGSAVAKYNLGMAQIRQVANPKDTTARNATLIQGGMKLLSEVAAMAKEKPGLASKANYNLGNLEFNRENYSEAISYYKQALRIDPNDANARKNLRIAQLKQQNQDNQDKNQDNKDQDKNQDQNKDQDKNQDQNKDQNQDKQDQQKDQNKEQPQEKDINQQTASQILQAIDNKESQTRARVNRANKGEKSEAAGRRVKKW